MDSPSENSPDFVNVLEDELENLSIGPEVSTSTKAENRFKNQLRNICPRLVHATGLLPLMSIRTSKHRGSWPKYYKSKMQSISEDETETSSLLSLHPSSVVEGEDVSAQQTMLNLWLLDNNKERTHSHNDQLNFSPMRNVIRKTAMGRRKFGAKIGTEPLTSFCGKRGIHGKFNQRKRIRLSADCNMNAYDVNEDEQSSSHSSSVLEYETESSTDGSRELNFNYESGDEASASLTSSPTVNNDFYDKASSSRDKKVSHLWECNSDSNIEESLPSQCQSQSGSDMETQSMRVDDKKSLKQDVSTDSGNEETPETANSNDNDVIHVGYNVTGLLSDRLALYILKNTHLFSLPANQNIMQINDEEMSKPISAITKHTDKKRLMSSSTNKCAKRLRRSNSENDIDQLCCNENYTSDEEETDDVRPNNIGSRDTDLGDPRSDDGEIPEAIVQETARNSD